MILIRTTPRMIFWARGKSKRMGHIRNSIRKGEGNIIGFIGEKIVEEYLGGRIENTYDYDIIFDGLKLDVKSKEVTSEPRGYYECSIAGYNIEQQCDIYVFVRIHKDLRKGWILGWLTKRDYFSKATLYKKGDKQESNNFTFHCDTYNVKINKLNDIDELKTKGFNLRGFTKL